MPDREKVIKGLEICSDCGFCESVKKFDLRCPYRNNDGKGCDRSQLLMDALALLKEQEAVEPIKGEDMDSSSACWWYVCPSCKIAIDYQDRFCRHCGQAMKWSDENDCQKNIER